jgi:hypothetical protein
MNPLKSLFFLFSSSKKRTRRGLKKNNSVKKNKGTKKQTFMKNLKGTQKGG